ncbi:MAG: ParB/RepB/Spo0J family partition protein [Calditrichaeota bacterium]|nr:ParB/RepB/Spo0J family partition protein [Calditrichota bacterium]
MNIEQLNPTETTDSMAIESTAPAAIQAMENAQLIPISYLEANPLQPRLRLLESDIEDLSTSVRDIGILEPLIVVRKGRKRYMIIAGHRRLAAAQMAELASIPCIVRDLNKDEILMYSLIENLQRTDLAAMEEARTLRQLIDQFDWTYREAAAKIGKSAAFVNDRLALLELPEDVKQALNEGRLSLKKAIELGKIPNTRLRARLLKKGNEGTFDEFKQLIEEEVSRVRKGRKPYEKQDLLADLRSYTEQVEGVRVFKDRLSIKFTSTQELIAIISQLIDLLKERESSESEN